uniref:Uncharacterized protein n=1 Tax=Oryza brachyantha TaxID=4533 RepID=J3N6B9_ORYBR
MKRSNTKHGGGEGEERLEVGFKARSRVGGGGAGEQQRRAAARTGRGPCGGGRRGWPGGAEGVEVGVEEGGAG